MQLHNLDDYHAAAKQRLPRIVYDLVAGGAGDEHTLEGNRRAFGRWNLRPKVLADIARRDLATTVMGASTSMPVLIAPFAFQRLAHREAELATARAAAASGIIFIPPTVTSEPLSEIASAGAQWFQLYPGRDRRDTQAHVVEASSLGYDVMCVTIDSPVPGLRERDMRNGVSTPWRMTPRVAVRCATRPRWLLPQIKDGIRWGLSSQPRAQITEDTHDPGTAPLQRPVTRDEFIWLRETWKGRLVAKGVLTPESCRQLVDLGVDGVVVSNHGGRNLDGLPPAMDALPDVAAAADGHVEVYVDGGVRRGTDIVKALALGAKACLVGRPIFYGLAVNGEAGVLRVLQILRYELDQAMAMLGCSKVEELDRRIIIRSNA